MRYLADVHISPIAIGALRAEGYEIFRATEFLPQPPPTESSSIWLAGKERC